MSYRAFGLRRCRTAAAGVSSGRKLCGVAITNDHALWELFWCNPKKKPLGLLHKENSSAAVSQTAYIVRTPNDLLPWSDELPDVCKNKIWNLLEPGLAPALFLLDGCGWVVTKMEHIFVLYQIQDTDTLHRKKPCLPLHIKTPICLSLMAKAWVHIVFAMKMYALRFSIKTSIAMLNLLSIFLASALDRKIRLQNRCLIVSEIWLILELLPKTMHPVNSEEVSLYCPLFSALKKPIWNDILLNHRKPC